MKKCTIITTINPPTNSILKHIENKHYDTIIVGDSKTPNSYKNLDCIYLDIDKQNSIFNDISNLIPFNHYSRKNLGYLYAIKNNYDIIYETDDDTEPKNNFDTYINSNPIEYKLISDTSKKWINYCAYFSDKNIWPRGYPLSQIRTDNNIVEKFIKDKPSIVCGLVDNDPDVDSIFRLVFGNKSIQWIDNKIVLIDNKNIGVFNTQNTFWIDKPLLCCMLIPTSVSFRYCDILRSIIANIVCYFQNKYIAITSSNVIQHRNQHDLIKDFSDEHSMFMSNETIMNYIDSGCNSTMDIRQLMLTIYQNLYMNNIISKKDIHILNLWINYIEDFR